MRVLITRASEDALGISHALMERGHEPVRIPLLERLWEVDAVSEAAIEHADADWLVITSGTTAEIIAAAAPNAWPEAKIAAVGPATARRMTAIGRPADFVPTRHTAACLANEIKGVRRKKVVYLKADLASSELADALVGRGAHVVEVVAYRNVAPPGHREALAQALPVDATLLLSGSAANRLADALPPDGTDRLGRVVVIGPSTRKATEAAGIPVHAMAEPYTLDGLLAAL